MTLRITMLNAYDVNMRNVFNAEHHNQLYYAQCRYAECHHTESRSAEKKFYDIGPW